MRVVTAEVSDVARYLQTMGTVTLEDKEDEFRCIMTYLSRYRRIDGMARLLEVRKGIGRIFRALKPDGVFYFTSTNKFSLVSGEYNFPLYGWLPDRWRYALRTRRQGEDIMNLGIDFNQFTFPQLRRFFRKTGFRV